jgi:hypothetical protein
MSYQQGKIPASYQALPVPTKGFGGKGLERKNFASYH